MTAGLIKKVMCSPISPLKIWQQHFAKARQPSKHLSALEQVDLICRARQGTGNPNRIYVKVPADFSTQTEEKLSVRQSENRPFDRQNSVRQTVRKLSPNNKEKKNNDSVKRHYECKEDESL